MALSKKSKNILKFSSPAQWWGGGWRDSLVGGNGIIGCSVSGGAAEDTVMLTHADLWWQGKAGVLPEVSENITNVRKLIDEGKPEQAGAVIPDALISKSYRPQLSCPLPLCDFKVSQKLDKPVKDYSRTLNLDNGEINVAFRDSSTKFQRSLFVSKKDDLIIFEINKWGNKPIDVDFSLALHEKFNNRTVNSIVNLPALPSSKAESKFISFAARSDNGLDFGAVGYINFFGGNIQCEGEIASIRGAEKVFVVIKPFINVKNREIRIKEIRDELKGFKLTYDKLLKEHSAIMAKTLNKAYIDIDDEDTLTDSDVKSMTELSPALIQKMWAYGRYLFVSSTTPASAPVAPYGIWCGDYKGADSSLNADGSMQLMYEHALAGNLVDYFDSLIGQYENCLDDLKKNAIRLYNCRGIMVPSSTAHGTGLLGQIDAKTVNFTGAAGWLSKLFYDAYLCARDAKFLRSRVLPFIKETAQFYLEFFTLKEDSYFESSPSYSPSSAVETGKNALIDFAIARQVFKSLIEISNELNAHKAEIPKWEEFLAHIPHYRVSSDGMVKEYFDLKQAETSSGSTSLFYPLFPNCEINTASGEIYKQFEKTAQKRFSFGGHQTSMSLMRYANVFIRLDQIGLAEEIIMAAIKHTTFNNLIFSSSDWTGMGVANNDIWARYTIESNLILTNAIQEMFIRSTSDRIWVLPACKVNKGQLGGFLTRAGVEVDELEWDIKKGQISLSLKAKRAATISLQLPMPIKRYKGAGNVSENTITDIELAAGKIVALDIKI